MNDFNYREINYSSNFIGFINQGKIYNQFSQQIGVTNEEYQKAIKTAKEFENVLYEKGILERPKTAEQINAELQTTIKQQQEALSSMMKAISDMGDKISKLEVKNVKRTDNTVDIRDNVKNDEAGESSKTKASVRAGK